MKAHATTLTLALTAALGTAGIAHAGGNPFALNGLTQGYQLAATEKAKDGKCGATQNARPADGKVQDGKCGGAKNSPGAGTKAKDGKCGEGKCGATSKKK